MKCLGLIGTVSDSVLEIYWQTIKGEAQKTLGAGRMPEFMVHCVKTRHLQTCVEQSNWADLTRELTSHGRCLISNGADALVVCGSALNPAAVEIHRSLDVPVIDLGYALTLKLRSLQVKSVAVLGIRTVAEETMWQEGLENVTVLQPSPEDSRWLTERANAAAAGQPISIDWKIETNRIVSGLRRSGARALILADPLLARWIRPGESLLYPIDAAEVHAWIAVLWAQEASFLPAPSCVICVD
jgi:aspartate/glutamate racemase